jgi:hypothetical protein
MRNAGGAPRGFSACFGVYDCLFFLHAKVEEVVGSYTLALPTAQLSPSIRRRFCSHVDAGCSLCGGSDAHGATADIALFSIDISGITIRLAYAVCFDVKLRILVCS